MIWKKELLISKSQTWIFRTTLIQEQISSQEEIEENFQLQWLWLVTHHLYSWMSLQLELTPKLKDSCGTSFQKFPLKGKKVLLSLQLTQWRKQKLFVQKWESWSQVNLSVSAQQHTWKINTVLDMSLKLKLESLMKKRYKQDWNLLKHKGSFLSHYKAAISICKLKIVSSFVHKFLQMVKEKIFMIQFRQRSKLIILNSWNGSLLKIKGIKLFSSCSKSSNSSRSLSIMEIHGKLKWAEIRILLDIYLEWWKIFKRIMTLVNIPFHRLHWSKSSITLLFRQKKIKENKFQLNKSKIWASRK